MSENIQSGQIKPHSQSSSTVVGFWIYLMTDLLVFASLFATFIVLRGYPSGSSSNHGIFDMPIVLIETLILLTSSFTAGIALLMVHKNQRRQAVAWLTATMILGAAFLGLELREFALLSAEGNGWEVSGFLSGFFGLVGLHGAHIMVGLIWLITLSFQVIKIGFTKRLVRQLTLFNIFWHFLDIVWIFIFTVVYLIGEMP